MKIGAFIQSTRPGTGMRPVEDVVADIQRAEELGYESAWLADHIFVERNGQRGAGHDPMVSLGYAAARTSRIALGTLVLGAPFRPLWQTAREAVALADASGGRYRLGLGAGWHKPEFDAFAIPFDHLVGRLEEQVSALSELLAGRRVSHQGPHVSLNEAEILATAPPPPIWIAGRGPRMLRLTARCADGWNIGWGGADPAWIQDLLSTLRRELEEAGRDPASLTTSIGVNVPQETTEAEIRDIGRAYEAAGVDLLIVWFAAGPGGPIDPQGMERVAAAVGIS